MKSEINEIEVNGIKYIKKGSVDSLCQAEELNGMKYVIVRTYSAGVHAGYLKSRSEKNVTLKKSRRIYYWGGAATLSQLAVDGTSKPNDCKFPCVLDEISLTEAIEIIPCTEKARISIQSVTVWSV